MKKIKTTVCIITAVLALTLALPAHAEGFRQGDKSDEIAAVQSVLKSKKLYSGEVNGLFDRLTAFFPRQNTALKTTAIFLTVCFSAA